jgi:hypothetical protein
MTTTVKPEILHNRLSALSIANSCTKDDCEVDYFTYRAIPWGDKYWVVEVSDDLGVIGYL